jgi:hypothetical protein
LTAIQKTNSIVRKRGLLFALNCLHWSILKIIEIMKRTFTIGITLMLAISAIAQTDPKATEVYEPKPAKVTPGKTAGEAPSDAIVLFDGKDLSEWQNPQFNSESGDASGIEKMLKGWDDNFAHKEAGWTVSNGEMVVKAGNGAIETKKTFDNFQLHIEWLSPVAEGKTGQGYSNSGIFLMSLYELQVLNSFENETYSNGQAGSIYKQSIPLVNASLPPGEWQSYDITFMAPVFDANGNVTSPAHVTVLHNGVLIQNNFELKGITAYIGQPRYIAHPEKMPLRLQDHGDPVRFRNIWIREL